MSNLVKPVILPGFMELLPREQIAFNRLKNIIRDKYEEFGFLPIDTPVIERSDVLLVKSGGETDKQVYRFEKGSTDMSLRFDLTVPLARYTAKNYSELEFPFKRYQIGKVFRGERNQRGRFRELYQCDIDIIGNGELDIANDAEMVAIAYSIFKEISRADFTIQINNRKILKGFFNYNRIENDEEIVREIDKLNKIGEEQLKLNLSEIGIGEDLINIIVGFIGIEGSPTEILKRLEDLDIDNPTFKEGLSEMSKLLQYLKAYGVEEKNYCWDLKLARGHDYYTGTVYEAVLDDYPDLGSVMGGGRYENLAQYYTNNKLPGVGISIGLTRLFFMLNEVGLINYENNSIVDALIICMGDYKLECIALEKKLGEYGIKSQVYFEDAKVKKKFSYADKLGIKYVVVIGESEIKEDKYTLKDMISGDQSLLDIKDLAEIIKRGRIYE